MKLRKEKVIKMEKRKEGRLRKYFLSILLASSMLMAQGSVTIAKGQNEGGSKKDVKAQLRKDAGEKRSTKGIYGQMV